MRNVENDKSPSMRIGFGESEFEPAVGTSYPWPRMTWYGVLGTASLTEFRHSPGSIAGKRRKSCRLDCQHNQPGSLDIAPEALVRQRWNAPRGRLARKARPYVNLQVAGVGSRSTYDAQFGGR
jgi:hypothetical protein